MMKRRKKLPFLSIIGLSLCFSLLPTRAFTQCVFFAASAGSAGPVTYNFSGGSFQSYGCAPIDPTYWVAGSGPNITVTFSAPQVSPIIRVWGMNTDDIASVQINGAPYTMNAATAYELPKVVCGLSPGPLGVVFSGGNIAGGNTPGQGNYSYSDVVINNSNVNSIRVTALAGAGWGFAAVGLACALPIDDQPITPTPTVEQAQKELSAWPNPTNGLLTLKLPTNFEESTVRIFNSKGKVMTRKTHLEGTNAIDFSAFPKGLYWIKATDLTGQTKSMSIQKI